MAPRSNPDRVPPTAPLIVRHPANPILTAADMPFDAECVFNCGVTVHNNQVVMLVNAWDSEWVPGFYVARSDDGVRFTVSPRKWIGPLNEPLYRQTDGIFDTRITQIDGWYYITYNTSNHLGGRIRLARTHDFESLEDMGFITQPDHRNCVLFSEKIDGAYVRLERPNINDCGDIYISYSPDLIHWGRTKLLLARFTRYWEHAKIGPGCPPIKTPQGWLCIYHGVRQGMNGFTYQAGCFLLDLKDPSRIIGKMNKVLLSPRELYERVGITANVVFPTGAIQFGDNPDELKIYYGCADTCMGLATASISRLVDECLRSPWKPY